MNQLSVEWAKAALIRACKTMAQTAVSMLTVGSTINQTNWPVIISVSLVAGAYSILTSVAGLPEVNAKEGGLSNDKG